jgi:WD40 repeat protein
VIILRGDRRQIDLIRFSPDSLTLVTASWACVQIWNDFTVKKQPILHFDSVHYVRTAAFTPNQSHLYVAGSSFAAVDLKARSVQTFGHEQLDVAVLSLSPDGNRMIVEEAQSGTSALIGLRSTSEPAANVWHRWTIPGIRVRPIFLASDAEFLRIEEQHVSGTPRQHRFALFSVTTGDVTYRSDWLAEEPAEIAVSPDGTTLACRTSKRLHFYPIQGGFTEPLKTIPNDGRKHFTAIAFHPSGRYLAATSNDATVKLYDTTTWDVARTFTWDIGRMRSIAFSPDGTLAAAGSDKGKVVVWDVDL